MNKVKGSDGRQYKSVNIKGKEYVEVSERVKHFHDMYEGKSKSITTEILHYYEDKGLWVVRATVQVGEDVYTGLAQEIEGVGMVNSTSALENAETSAIGRALGFLNIGVVDLIASADEINKAKKRSYTKQKRLAPDQYIYVDDYDNKERWKAIDGTFWHKDSKRWAVIKTNKDARELVKELKPKIYDHEGKAIMMGDRNPMPSKAATPEDFDAVFNDDLPLN